MLRFWSDAFPADQRLAAWRRIVNETLMAAEVEELSNHTFHAEATLRILPEFRAGIGFLAPCRLRRTREIVAADNDDFYLIVNMEGPFDIELPNSKFSLEEGDCCFLSCGQEVSLLRPVGGRLLCLRVGRERLSTLLPNIDEYGGSVIPRGNEASRLLQVYMRELDHNQGLTGAELRRLVTTHVYDLIALVLRSAHEVSAAKPRDSHTASRLRAIKKYIADHAGGEDLTVATVAAAHRLSTRQVQRLFEASDTTFSEYILLKRLQNVHTALTDPRQGHRSITDIALANGFGDVSYFNRAFRRQFGASPSEVRQAPLVQST